MDAVAQSTDLCRQRDRLRKSVQILLATKGCIYCGEPEIPEEISAQFDINLAEAKLVHDTLMESLSDKR